MTTSIYEQADTGPEGCNCGWFYCAECFPLLNKTLMDEVNR